MEYIHHGPGEEASALGWSYTVREEKRIQLQETSLLAVNGSAIVGSACVGAVDLQVVVVPGYILSWHYRRDIRGRTLSLVNPIDDGKERDCISNLLKTHFPSQQIIYL